MVCIETQHECSTNVQQDGKKLPNTDVNLPSVFWHRFWAVRYVKLAISSAFERTLIYRIISY